MVTNLGGLVDGENGLISRIFIEPEIYAQELDRIFARCWLFLRHESQVPEPGDSNSDSAVGQTTSPKM
jgi:phenylpropionate dioxygenase-like ring-hydroxylating dioxygenase large terminal subunit